jgi:hypothetical protein
MERVAELSGASVPFRFDIHTLFFSEDAVTLENELHKHFATKAANQANPRKEFFFATPSEVRDVLVEKWATFSNSANKLMPPNTFNPSSSGQLDLPRRR